jgi:hypothetical protein
VGPRAGLNVCEKSRPHRDFKNILSVHNNYGKFMSPATKQITRTSFLKKLYSEQFALFLAPYIQGNSIARSPKLLSIKIML